MRLIDADALRDNMQWSIDHDMYDKPYDYLADIDDAQTIDAVEVVRCKDCRYSHMTYDGDCKYCDKWKEDGEALYLEGDFYCAYGERKKKCKECWYWSEVHKHCENNGGCQFKPYGEYKDGKEE